MDQNTQSGSGAVTNRRTNARARLEIPARLILLDGQCRCTVDNLSREGARISCDQELEIGSHGILQRDGLEGFFTVQWAKEGHYGLNFDDPIQKPVILALRQIADDYDGHREESLREFGREWVAGTAGHSGGG